MNMLTLTVRQPYAFAASVQDYGWIALAPCRWHPEKNEFQRVERLSTGKVVALSVAERPRSGSDAATLSLEVEAAEPPSSAERQELIRKLRWMLRLDEDLGPFYERARADERLWATVRRGRGRLLRSPTLFEDVVKTICTTNTTWRQTKGMVERLVGLCGSPHPLRSELHAFPTPGQVTAAGADALRQEVRLGYRSGYVYQLAQEIATGRRELESLKEERLPVAELRKKLRSIKGVGEYATNNLLMLLGHYGELALDSEMRAFVRQRYFDGHQPTDREILSIYDHWQEWKYLTYWFDLIA